MAGLNGSARPRAGMHRFKVEFVTIDEAEANEPRTDRWVVGLNAFTSEGEPDRLEGGDPLAVVVVGVDRWHQPPAGPYGITPPPELRSDMRAISGRFPTSATEWPLVMVDVVFTALRHLLGDSPTANMPKGWQGVESGGIAVVILRDDDDHAAFTAEINEAAKASRLDMADTMQTILAGMRDRPGARVLAVGVIRTPLQRGENDHG